MAAIYHSDRFQATVVQYDGVIVAACADEAPSELLQKWTLDVGKVTDDDWAQCVENIRRKDR